MKKIEIIGRTNQGKSSLFNALIKKNMAITADEEHTTRDYVRFWGTNFVLTDNIGLDRGDLLPSRIFEENILLYVVSKDNLDDIDRYFFKQLRVKKKTFYLVITKCDNKESELSLWKTTGAVNIFFTSTKNNFNLQKLRDFLDINLEDLEDPKKTIAIIGGVNSGKSSLLNLLAGYNRNQVNKIAATTRDPIMEPIGKYYFVDTAGFNMIDKKIEKIALSRSREIIKNSNMCIIVVDSSISFSQWNKWLWAQCEKYNKGIILLFNKEDILKKEQISKKYLLESWSVRSYIPYMFFSTINPRSENKIKDLMLLVDKVIKSTEKKITKSQLERFVHSIDLPHNNNRINLVQKYPHNFILYCKKPVTKNYMSYLENQIINYFKIVGIRPYITYEKMKYD